jgi:hypothetical protein
MGNFGTPILIGSSSFDIDHQPTKRIVHMALAIYMFIFLLKRQEITEYASATSLHST